MGKGRRDGQRRKRSPARRAVAGFAMAGMLACVAASPAAGAVPGTPTAGPCTETSSGAVFEVTVHGFKAPTGYILVYLYAADQRRFMEHNQWIGRIELPVRSLAPVLLCVPAPGPGPYAISVRHDVDGNRQRTDMNDGGGFSRNPHLSLLHLRPRVDAVALTAAPGVQRVDIVLNYRQGLRVGPWRR